MQGGPYVWVCLGNRLLAKDAAARPSLGEVRTGCLTRRQLGHCPATVLQPHHLCPVRHPPCALRKWPCCRAPSGTWTTVSAPHRCPVRHRHTLHVLGLLSCRCSSCRTCSGTWTASRRRSSAATSSSPPASAGGSSCWTRARWQRQARGQRWVKGLGQGWGWVWTRGSGGGGRCYSRDGLRCALPWAVDGVCGTVGPGIRMWIKEMCGRQHQQA